MDGSRLSRISVGRRTCGPMSAWAVVVAAVATLGFFGPILAQVPGDSAAVRDLVEAYRTSWDGHDASDLAEFFTEDADMIMGTAPIALGREAIEGWWRAYFEQQEPQRQVAIEVLGSRLIGPDVAVVNVRTTTHGRTAQGEELRPRYARGTWVVAREGGVWMIAAMRGMPTEQDEVIRASGGAPLAILPS